MVYRNIVSHSWSKEKTGKGAIGFIHLAKQRKVYKMSLSLSQLIPTRRPREGILMCSFLGIVNFYKAMLDVIKRNSYNT